MAIHFRSGSKPILLSISEEAHTNLYRDIQGDSKFLSVRDLGNRTLAIRRDAISDLYFSSEAYDWYGPEHDTCDLATPIQLPDPRDWEIIEALAADDDGIEEDFAPEDVKRVSDMVMITDEQYKELVADGRIKPEELEAEKAKNSANTQEIFELAKGVSYQLTAGPLRRVSYLDCDDEVIYSVFENLVEFGDNTTNEVIRLPAEGYHRTIFINPNALDYISFPTHLLERAGDDISDELIESIGDDDDKPTRPTKRRQRGSLKVVK